MDRGNSKSSVSASGYWPSSLHAMPPMSPCWISFAASLSGTRHQCFLFGEEQREAQGLRAEALDAFIFWSVSGFVLRSVCVCVWVSSRASGDWQGRGGTDRRMVSGGQMRADPASHSLAPSTRFLCSTPASPVCNTCLHTQVLLGLSWQVLPITLDMMGE